MKNAASIIAVLAMAASAAQAQTASVNDGAYSAAQAERGSAVYAAECALCHGPALTGGGGGPALSGPFWTAWDGRTIGELFRLTKKSMPFDGPGRLSDQEYADIVAFMLSANRYPAGKADLPADVEALSKIAIAKRK
jgi:mono/diheme cytochrome c family protein